MEKIKKNRKLSFLIVGAIYALATVVGVVTYNILTFDWWLSLLIADVVATVFTFIFSLIFKNASVYDPYWSVQPPVILTAFAIGKELTALGVLLLIVIFFWAIRLTANWAYTFGNLEHQDWRYTMLKEKTGAFYPLINFIGIHMVPTLVVYGCIVPAVYAVVNKLDLNVGCIAFLCLSLASAAMQGAADIQMHKYQKNRTMPFIRDGLWKYSRHPNYLAEILMWWNIGLLCVTSLHGYWYILIGAVANTMLFMFVSIPLADGKQSKKDGFLEYKKATRMLLPIKK
jgi:steroid 5-alpha reductase family enzyme